MIMTDFFGSKNTMNFVGIATMSLGAPKDIVAIPTKFIVFLLPKKSVIIISFPNILLAAIIPSFTAVGHIGFLPVISPAP